MSERAGHWDDVFAAGPSDLRSWYEREPTQSLRLIEAATSDRSAAIVDIGGGTSTLVDRLLESGFVDVTVLDISRVALDEVRGRLADSGEHVSLVQHDVIAWQPPRQYDVWHDRAVFHFLTDSTDRDRYVSVAEAGVARGGSLVVATFADDGPTHCSGLAVCRYSANELCEVFAAGFEPVHRERESHETPSGAVQPFTWVVLRRKAEDSTVGSVDGEDADALDAIGGGGALR